MRLSNLPVSSSNGPSCSLAKEGDGRYFALSPEGFARSTNVRVSDMYSSHGLSFRALYCCRPAGFMVCSIGTAATTLNAFEIWLAEHSQKCLLLLFTGYQCRRASCSPIRADGTNQQTCPRLIGQLVHWIGLTVWKRFEPFGVMY